MKFTCPFILASGSPRRKQLLLQLGMDFRIQVSDADESFVAGTAPALIAEQIATRKVDTISALTPNALTLAADTIVVIDDEVLGKPETANEAIEMLSRLRNRQHYVYTGLALSHPASGRQIIAHEKTGVFFADLSDEEISTYVAGGSPMDKAGAYGIQDDRGALFVSRIEGDFYNVVGLPLHRLYEMVKQHFSDLLV
ncbi:MAG: nucleoside triphosphate pyrophosphatase [Rhodothermales bacterium]